MHPCRQPGGLVAAEPVAPGVPVAERQVAAQAARPARLHDAHQHVTMKREDLSCVLTALSLVSLYSF